MIDRITIKRKCKHGVVNTFHVLNLIGKKFGKLMVIEKTRKKGRYFWICRCECGGSTTTSGWALKSGHTVSCGCTNKGHITHGLSGTIEYHTWHLMIGRCHDPRNSSYKNYHSRGIVVCNGWRNSVQSFISDMGKRPSSANSIERIDNNMNYSCGHCLQCVKNGWVANCKWDTWHAQVRNMSVNVIYEFGGEKLILKDWARKKNIEYSTLWGRLKRGWDFEKAISIPANTLKYASNKRHNKCR